MSKNLRVVDVYDSTSDKTVNEFNKSIKSSYSINSNYEKVDVDFEWLDVMEDSIKYIDNILRNPNRYIINEEEIVKVELARKITVESVKHLAKHTNYIQKIEDNGDVKPSKVLNINKDETLNSYENRVIYTLIQNMRTFVELKKKDLIEASSLKDEKKCEYNAQGRVGIENVSMNVTFTSKANSSTKVGEKDGLSIFERIDNLERKISELSNSRLYLALVKAHVARVIPPIKKTNLILKNVNFQYAMKLWDYLQENFDSTNKKTKKKDTITTNTDMHQMLDDIFLLNYLALDTLSETKDKKAKLNEETVDVLTTNMISKIVQINSDISLEELQEIIGDKLAIIKTKGNISLDEIKNKFNNKIIALTNRISDFDFR